jgi:hypothetical protein
MSLVDVEGPDSCFSLDGVDGNSALESGHEEEDERLAILFMPSRSQ